MASRYHTYEAIHIAVCILLERHHLHPFYLQSKNVLFYILLEWSHHTTRYTLLYFLLKLIELNVRNLFHSSYTSPPLSYTIYWQVIYISFDFSRKFYIN